MDNFYNDLAWKNDNPFFINLNKNLELLRESLISANKDLSLVGEFLNQLNSFKVIYSPYLTPRETYEDEYAQARQYFLSIEYYNFLNKKIKNSSQYTKCMQELEKLNNVAEQFIINLEANNILPKVIKKKKYDPKKAISNTTY